MSRSFAASSGAVAPATDRSGPLLLTAGLVFTALGGLAGLSWWVGQSVVRWTGSLSPEWDLLLVAALVLGACGLLLLTLSRSCSTPVRVLTGLGSGLLALAAVALMWLASIFSVFIYGLGPGGEWVFSADGSRAAMLVPQANFIDPAWGVVIIKPGRVARVMCEYNGVFLDRDDPPRLRFVDNDSLVVGGRTLHLGDSCSGS